MKKIITLVLVVLTMIIITSCSNAPNMTHDDKLVCIYRGVSSGFNVYVDVDTRVQYVYNVNQGGLIVRVDENGEPMLYEGELPGENGTEEYEK